MKERYNPVQVTSVSLATITATIFIVVATIVSELSKNFKDFLADLTGHHWVTKGVIALGIFIIIWLLSSLGLNDESRNVKVWSMTTVAFAIAGILAIFIFYAIHFLTAAH